MKLCVEIQVSSELEGDALDAETRFPLHRSAQVEGVLIVVDKFRDMVNRSVHHSRKRQSCQTLNCVWEFGSTARE